MGITLLLKCLMQLEKCSGSSIRSETSNARNMKGPAVWQQPHLAASPRPPDCLQEVSDRAPENAHGSISGHRVLAPSFGKIYS